MREKKKRFQSFGLETLCRGKQKPRKIQTKEEKCFATEQNKSSRKSQGKLGLERNRKRASWELKKKKKKKFISTNLKERDVKEKEKRTWEETEAPKYWYSSRKKETWDVRQLE